MFHRYKSSRMGALPTLLDLIKTGQLYILTRSMDDNALAYVFAMREWNGRVGCLDSFVPKAERQFGLFYSSRVVSQTNFGSLLCCSYLSDILSIRSPKLFSYFLNTNIMTIELMNYSIKFRELSLTVLETGPSKNIYNRWKQYQLHSWCNM